MDRFSSPNAPRVFARTANTLAENTGKMFGQMGLGGANASRLSSSFGATPQRREAPRVSNSLSQSFGGISAPRLCQVGFSPQYGFNRPAAVSPGGAGYEAGGGPTGGAPATYTPGFGQFTPDVDPEINAAAAKYGVPANFLKTIIAKESSGRWGGSNTGPVWVGSHSPQLGHILGYVGVFKKTADSRGLGHLWAAGAQGNRQAQIELLAGVLRSQLDDIRQRDPNYGWLNVAAYHYSGDPSGNTNPAGWEKHGTTRDYMAKTAAWWNQLEPRAATGGPTGGAPAAGAGQVGALSMVWGNKGNPNLDYGYNAPSSLGLYSYGKQYGMNGVNHTGIDIPMPINSPSYTPVSGTVVCACTGSGGGCAAFSDVMGSGCGRIELQLDNGHRLIFGHMSRTSVKLGQRVNVGQQIGTVGGMNGAHIHLEYRVPDPSMPSGFRIVDPAQYIGGKAGPVSGAPVAGAPVAAPSAPPPINLWRYTGGATQPARVSAWRS